jgi:hypothetical protein
MSVARMCDGCRRLIEQDKGEAINLHLSVIDCEEDADQDGKTQATGDFCDTCLANGTALRKLLATVEWTLAPKAGAAPQPGRRRGNA